MNIEVKKENGNTVICLNTRLDSTTAGELDEVIQKEVQAVENNMIVDLKNVDFVSSIGLRVLVSAYKSLDGKQMIIKNANSSIIEVLKLSGLLSLFTVE